MKNISLSINLKIINNLYQKIWQNQFFILGYLLFILSCISFMIFYFNGLGLSYNDARSHLDIGRRVVEGLKPGLAQLGSVWLPLNHILMIPFIWNDFLWHSGLAGAISSMASYILTGLLIYKFLEKIGVKSLGKIVGVAVFALNLNVLYLQSTAMTELLLLATSMAACYYLLLWSEKENILDLIKSAFFTTLAVLTRYDGWFLFAMITGIVVTKILLKPIGQGHKIIFADFKPRFKQAEGVAILFVTLAGLGIIAWFLWNLLIFKDPLYFAIGPYSAHTQQQQLEQANNLATKKNLLLSTQTYFYALTYNIGAVNLIFGLIGAILFWIDRKVQKELKIASVSLTAPLFFNIIALYLGFSVLFIQGLFGNTWFNVRYGIMVIPFVAIFIGLLIDRLPKLKYVIIGILIMSSIFSFLSQDAVTIDDARVGASQKNVSEVASFLKMDTKNEPGFVLISAASHDAIIFSSGLPMSKFIHEGTGNYWKLATQNPDKWARWIVMRTYDDNDATWKAVSQTPGFAHYQLVAKYPFADVYKLDDKYSSGLITTPILGKQK